MLCLLKLHKEKTIFLFYLREGELGGVLISLNPPNGCCLGTFEMAPSRLAISSFFAALVTSGERKGISSYIRGEK